MYGLHTCDQPERHTFKATKAFIDMQMRLSPPPVYNAHAQPQSPVFKALAHPTRGGATESELIEQTSTGRDMIPHIRLYFVES